MANLLPNRLLTTRMRVGAALGLTAILLALAILHRSQANSGWLFTNTWHGWLPTGLDIFFFCYLCWLGLAFIRRTVGPERIFVIGWFATILLSPLATLRPQWAETVKNIGMFGLAVALLAALSLLFKSSDMGDSQDSANISKGNETVTDFLFPPKARPYWTFRNATAIALLATTVTTLVRAFVKFPPGAALSDSHNLFHSPLFISLYYLLVAIVLWLVHVTRHRASWYVWRVWVYGAVLTGALIGLVDLILPLHAS
jgi:hypothetical protein